MLLDDHNCYNYYSFYDLSIYDLDIDYFISIITI